MSSATQKEQTPMLKQYFSIKQKYPDSILFFRLGDFYEMFFEDAVEASKILEIALTSRNKGDAESVPLCGVPHHAAESYIAKLLARGKKVAICDQVEDPRAAKGVVKRAVTRVVTPGVVFNNEVLEAKAPHYVAACCETSDRRYALSFADISTGNFELSLFKTFREVLDECLKQEPKELLLPVSWEKQEEVLFLQKRHPFALYTFLNETSFDPQALPENVTEKITGDFKKGLSVAGALWNYLTYTQQGKSPELKPLEIRSRTGHMVLDENAQRNLEIFKTQSGEKVGSLFWHMDKTETSMGGRLLRQWLAYPLMDLPLIQARQQAVTLFLEDPALRRFLEEGLRRIPDMERLTGKIVSGVAHVRDLVQLKNALQELPAIRETLASKEGVLQELGDQILLLKELTEELDRTFVENPPLTVKEGGFVRDGHSSVLDELRKIAFHGKEFLAQLEQKEREATGISSLKIRYNSVFGYYIEITHTHKDKIPERYIRKQTLVNAERYITPELKEYEEKVLGAEEKIGRLEYEMFLTLRDKVAQQATAIRQSGEKIAVLDCLLSLAQVAFEHRYVRPRVTNVGEIEIEGGRHPIVERFSTDPFVPNNISFNDEESRFLMITGPNMAGKSTIMRQTALIVLLSQIGSFVPADSANVGLVDRIFTRVGASDRLIQGQSTFMVEMVEAAHILNEATEKSLILIDEIGRGTSTYDGVSIAWAIAEYIHNTVKAKTLFATHYHELIDLAAGLPGMKNMNVVVKEWNGQIIFLHQLVPGSASRSYGIEVAKLAGVPSSVIQRAKEVLKNLEEEHGRAAKKDTEQMGLFEK